MSGQQLEYDPTQVSLTAFGIPISGYADGEFVTVERESDTFADVVGTDGDVSRARSSDKRITITIKLMQTSQSNTLLSAVHNLDDSVPGGAGVGAFQLKDRLGNTIVRCDKAWIAKPPDISMDRTPTAREWKLRGIERQRLDGGN